MPWKLAGHGTNERRIKADGTKGDTRYIQVCLLQDRKLANWRHKPFHSRLFARNKRERRDCSRIWKNEKALKWMKFLNRVLPYDGLPSGTRLGAFGVSVADQFHLEHLQQATR